MSTSTSIRVSGRVRGFTYAIRNIVAEAKKVEATGRKVRASILATRSRSGSIPRRT